MNRIETGEISMQQVMEYSRLLSHAHSDQESSISDTATVPLTIVCNPYVCSGHEYARPFMTHRSNPTIFSARNIV